MITATITNEGTETHGIEYVGEVASGFALAPATPQGKRQRGIGWGVDLVAGTRTDRRCNRTLFGFAQNIVTYRAQVTWESGTTWVWYLDKKLPARDAIKFDDGTYPKAPWYNDKNLGSPQTCGEAIRVFHEDTPDLLAGSDVNYPDRDKTFPNAIPWNDPRTRLPLSARSAFWQIDFDAFLLQKDSAGGRPKVLLAKAWSLQVNVGFDMKQPVGKRGRIAPGATLIVRTATRSQPVLTGNPARIRVAQYSSVRDADAAHR